MANYLDQTGLERLVSNIKANFTTSTQVGTAIDTKIANKANKATTLAGYGIIDAKISNGVITLGTATITPLTSHQSLSNYYTKAEVDGKVSAIPKFAISVVSSLPTSGISTTTIYLLKTGSETNNLYTEYIYVDSKWETLGTQTMDMSDYLTKTDASTTYLGKTAAAASANKLNTDAGSATQPIYFSNGVPVATTYTLGASVPSGAKFTDTVYTLPAATSSVLGGVKIGSNISVSAGTISLSKANVTAALGYTPPTSNTTYSAGAGLSLSSTKFTNTAAVYFVKGTQTSATNAWTGTLPTGVTEYTDGLTINYYLPYAGTSTAATLNLGSLGAKNVYVGHASSSVTTHYPAGSVIQLTYIASLNSNAGGWKVSAYYDSNTQYSDATQSTHGLMTAADKIKLDGIAAGANKYSLPAATSSTLGGVKVGSNISVSSGTISLVKSNVTSALGYTPVNEASVISNDTIDGLFA